MTMIDPYIYQAAVIRQALTMYKKTGMKVNRAYSPKAMMLTAERITGKTFKARDYAGAIDALNEWIAEESMRKAPAGE